jgi:hypothetical protein
MFRSLTGHHRALLIEIRTEESKQTEVLILFSGEEIMHLTLCRYNTLSYIKIQGHAVAQLVEALRYKPEDCGIGSGWCHLNFSLT